MIFYCYALIDPRTRCYRYIGSTNNPTTRFKTHLFGLDGTGPKRRWIKKLRSLGLKPKFKILGTSKTRLGVLRLELEMMEKHPARLLNGAFPISACRVNRKLNVRLTEASTEKMRRICKQTQRSINKETNIAVMQYKPSTVYRDNGL